MKSFIASLALAGFLTGCGTAGPDAQPSPSVGPSAIGSTASPAEIAQAYIREKRPDWDRALRLRPVVVDRGTRWQVTFDPGGSPVIMIDKQTRQVVDAFSQ
jgi:hypothetical protein